MNQKDIQDAYVAGAEALISDWETKTPSQRKASALMLVNTTLAGDLPQLHSLPADGSSNYASFKAHKWGVVIHDDLLTKNEVPNKAPMRANDMRVNNPRFLFSAVYHEARHSEQRFLVARFLATTRHPPSATKIVHALDIPIDIAQSAIRAGPSLIADRRLFSFAKWLYVGGFTRSKVEEQRTHQKELNAAREAAHREKRYIEVSAKGWYGTGIANGYGNDWHMSPDERRAAEHYRLAEQTYYRAYDAYAKEIKEEDARLASYRVAALLGVGGNRLMDLLGRRGAMDTMRDP